MNQQQEVIVLKEKNGIPTKINYKGKVYILSNPSTFAGVKKKV